MLNDKIFSLYPDMINYIPEFQDFIRMCFGISVKVTIVKKIDEKIGTENLATLRTIELGEKNPVTRDVSSKMLISASWIDSIDYEGISEEIKEYTVSSYPENTSAEDLAMFQRDDAAIVSGLRELQSIKVPYGFQGSVETPDMSITLSDGVVQTMIMLEEQGIVVAYGTLDENKALNDLQVCFYDSIFTLDENIEYMECNSAYEPTINVNNIKQTVERLKTKGIMPVRESSVNLAELLTNYNLANLQNAPIAAIYQLKTALIELTKPRNI